MNFAAMVYQILSLMRIPQVDPSNDDVETAGTGRLSGAMEKFVRKHSELPVDAPLSATDGFLWSRLENPQDLENLVRLTGLPVESVRESLKSLAAAGLINRVGLPSTQESKSGQSASTGKPTSAPELVRIVQLGHQVLDAVNPTQHWPELGGSREQAFESFRRVSRIWLDRFRGVRGSGRLEGEKLLSRLRRLRDSAPHEQSFPPTTQMTCLWLMGPEKFIEAAGKLHSTDAGVHPGVAAGKRTRTSVSSPERSKPKKSSPPGKDVTREAMDKRRAEIEARRKESMKPAASAKAPSSGVSSGAHRVAGLDAQALYNKAVSAFGQGLVEESARAIQLALAMTPDDPKLQALDAEVSLEWKRQRAHKLAKQAANDWTVGLIEPAVNKIVEAADLVPDYASISAQAADYCLLTGKLDLAVEFADRAVVNAPSRLDYRLAAAAAFYAAGDELVAREQLSTIKTQIKELESRSDD